MPFVYALKNNEGKYFANTNKRRSFYSSEWVEDLSKASLYIKSSPVKALAVRYFENNKDMTFYIAKIELQVVEEIFYNERIVENLKKREEQQKISNIRSLKRQKAELEKRIKESQKMLYEIEG
jgi:hypothetical protein